MSFSTTVFNAIWTKLNADRQMSALLRGGTLFQFNGGLLKRLEPTPVICPFFAMAPAPEGHHWPPAKRKRGPAAMLERRVSFLIEMGTKGDDSRDILALAEGFEDFMARQFETDNFGIGQLFAEAEYAKLVYVPKVGVEKNIEMWMFTCTMTCKFRLS